MGVVLVETKDTKMLKLFKKHSLEDDIRRWKRHLRSEQRKLELQILKINREEQKVKVSMKQAVKANDTVAARMLAKELIQSRKAVSRIHAVKAQMNSVSMQLQNQVAQKKMIGLVTKSTEIMKEINSLVRVREVRESMQQLGKEIHKAGLMEEIANDAIDNALDDEISDTELEEEVNKVVEEVTQKQMEGARVGTTKLPTKETVQTTEHEKKEDEDELMAKLAALRTT